MMFSKTLTRRTLILVVAWDVDEIGFAEASFSLRV
jgi:hypothetical protein